MTPSFRHKHRVRSEAGSILATSLMSVAVLAMFAAVALYRVQPRLATTYHSASWSEALNAAESGMDMALQAMNNSVTSPGTAWAGWTPSDAATFPKTWVPTIAAHGGDGNTKIYCKVTVDNSIVDGTGAKWMRARSQGVAELPAASRAGIESGVRATNGTKTFRSILRKERFRGDQTGGVLRLPQITRTLEALAAPPGTRLYIRGLTTQNFISMSGSAYTDSFDSTDPAKSTGGQYDPLKKQSHGDIATNAAGGLSNLRSTYVWGDASSNGGAILNATNVQGNSYNNFTTTLPPVAKPVWSTFNVSPVAINNPGAPVTLPGGPAGSPQNYKLTTLTISNASNPLILAPHAAGAESYVNIWVTGKTTVSGSGFIQQQPGVHVQIFSEDDITVSGGGVMNQTNVASNLQIFGVTPASGTNKVTVSGSANFIGILNAPAFDITISGSGRFCGAAIGNSAVLSGGGGFHYDEDLANFGGGSGNAKYQYASWIEDIR